MLSGRSLTYLATSRGTSHKANHEEHKEHEGWNVVSCLLVLVVSFVVQILAAKSRQAPACRIRATNVVRQEPDYRSVCRSVSGASCRTRSASLSGVPDIDR